MAHSAGLTGHATTVREHQDVETITLFSQHEGLPGRNLSSLRGEVVLERATVDGNLARSGAEENAGDAGFAASGP